MSGEKGLYAVVGANGRTGSVIANTLIERGARVRVIVLEKSRGDAWAERSAEVAVANVNDSKALTEALRGTDGAFLMSPSNLSSKDFFASRRESVASIAAAVEASRVPHLVYLSSMASQQSTGTGSIRAMRFAENELGKLRTNCTFIRAAYFMENWRLRMDSLMNDGILRTIFNPSLAIEQVAARDVAQVAADALLKGVVEKKRIIECSGPGKVSPNGVADALTEILGRTISVAEVPDEWKVASLMEFGYSEDAAKLVTEMYAGMSSEQVRWEGGHEFMRGTTTIHDVLMGFTETMSHAGDD